MELASVQINYRAERLARTNQDLAENKLSWSGAVDNEQCKEILRRAVAQADKLTTQGYDVYDMQIDKVKSVWWREQTMKGIDTTCLWNLLHGIWTWRDCTLRQLVDKLTADFAKYCA